MQVRLKEPTDQAWVESVLRRCWGGSDIVVRGYVYRAADLPALIAGTQDGLCTFAIESDGMSAELVDDQRSCAGEGNWNGADRGVDISPRCKWCAVPSSQHDK